ncbi:hypothetical protein BCR44DRAFT_1440186 [Catenaria anguillulae PL171]|uniref:SEP domain-containing protein n=1 Tax=Catenaria anguillulae PL171 TaxID=765915 RepID=A0A1Y2HCV8_9FUNG|nr:hypothetical protein BCR44DRAFT_1440186 [Catenaria anguillulae PL171]
MVVSATERSARLVSKTEAHGQVYLVVFKDGIRLDDCPPMMFGDPEAMQVLHDLEDGYFPEILKERFPDGVPIRLVDKSKHSLHDTSLQPHGILTKSPSPPLLRTTPHDTVVTAPTVVQQTSPPASPAITSPLAARGHHSCPILNLSSLPATSSSFSSSITTETSTFPLTIKVQARTGPIAILHCDARDTPRALADYLLKHGMLPASSSAVERSFRPGRPTARSRQGFWMPRARQPGGGTAGGGLLDEDEAFVDVLGPSAVGSVVLYWD